MIRLIGAAVVVATTLFSNTFAQASFVHEYDRTQKFKALSTSEDLRMYHQNYRGCIRSCDLDTNPCDPLSFKSVDGRCSGD